MVQIAALLAMMASTSRDRRCGRLPVNIPMAIPDRIAATTDNVSRVPATCAESPWATVRYGTPHISAKTVTENWVPMWVKNPSRVPGRSHTVLTLAQDLAERAGLRVGGLTVRGVLDQRQRQGDRQHSESDHGDIGRRPACAGEQREEGDGREHLAELAADPRQLRDKGNLLRPEPVRHQPQHRDEGDRVAEADNSPCGDRGGQRLGERQRQLTRRHHRRTGNDQRFGAEPVEQQARGHLGACVDHDLKNDERRQQPGTGGESVAGLQPRDSERGAVEDGDDVCEETGGPNDPGTHAENSRNQLCLNVCRHLRATGGCNTNSLPVRSLTRSPGNTQRVRRKLAGTACPRGGARVQAAIYPDGWRAYPNF